MNTLFDQVKKATDAGIEKGINHANREWRNTTLESLQRFCWYTETFTMNEFRAFAEKVSDAETHDKRAMGGIVRTALKMGWIEPTGRTIRSVVGHGVPLQIWKSLILKK